MRHEEPLQSYAVLRAPLWSFWRSLAVSCSPLRCLVVISAVRCPVRCSGDVLIGQQHASLLLVAVYIGNRPN